MYGIDILMNEHKNILKFTDELEKICINVMNGGKIDQEFFKRSISFIREYADNHHHKKEEDIIFKYMIDNLGREAKVLVKNGMVVEHDLARLKIMELEKALKSYDRKENDMDKLSIITNSMSYVYLLRRHIDKEDRVVYTFAQNNLSKDILNKINKETKVIETEAKKNGNIDGHLSFLDQLLNE